nr:AIR synthase related protein [Corynebacterium cyclohexanicum]
MTNSPRLAPRVGELSEGELLERIFPRLAVLGSPILGPGDDAAVIAAPDGRVVVSTDTQTEGQDFRLVWPNGYRSTGADVGWKAAAQNLSDINAMGAVATSMVVSLTLPPETGADWVEGLADGLVEAIRALGADGCTVAGGDLGRGGSCP